MMAGVLFSSQIFLLIFVTLTYGIQDPVLKVEGLGTIKGRFVKTVGYRGRNPKIYQSFRNIKYAEIPGRFKVTSLILWKS